MTIIKLSFFASLCLLLFFIQCFAAPKARLQFFLPPSLPTCMPVQMQWSNAIGPKANLSIFTFDPKNALPHSKPVREFLNLDAEKGSHIWRIDLPSNQDVLIRLTDSAHRSIDSTVKIIRSVTSEPPCKIEGQSTAQSTFQQMSCESTFLTFNSYLFRLSIDFRLLLFFSQKLKAQSELNLQD